MNARDELAELLEEEQESGRWASSPTADLYGFMADAILAAGYTKPRTITTVDELVALAAGSVLVAGSRIYQKERGALMDLGIGLLGYEEVLDECGRLLCVYEPTA